MPIRCCKFSSAVLVLGSWLLAGSAWAQACCGAGATVTPARLAPCESWLVGLQVRGTEQIGSFSSGSFQPVPKGASEQDFGQSLIGAARLSERWQAALSLPVVETRRQFPGLTSSGGGLGDADLLARYDAIWSDRSSWLPGVALFAGLTMPTGRAIDQVSSDVNATGTGRWAPRVGVALEALSGRWFGQLASFLGHGTPRTVGGIADLPGWTWTSSAAIAANLADGFGVGAVIAWQRDTDATVNGAVVAGSGVDLATVTLSGLWQGESLRLGASVAVNPPVGGLSSNTVAGGSVGLTAMWVFE